MEKNYARALTEGAIMVAIAQVLSLLKLYEFPFGGSITLATIPIIFYAVRWGFGQGLLAGFAFGVLQLLFDGAYAYVWQAMILDYLLAFTLLGTAGLFKKMKHGIFYGAVLGSFMRFAAHLFSGVYVWKEYMPDVFLGIPMSSAWVYSALYNSIYNAANMVLAIIVFAVLFKPMNKYIRGEDLK